MLLLTRFDDTTVLGTHLHGGEETAMNLIVTLVIGGVVGWLASLVMKTNAQMGIIANIVVGIVGSFLGFWVAGLIGLGASSGIGHWLIALGGAVLLILILKALKVLK